MAERSRLSAYVVCSACCTVIYSFPAHWIWSPDGFLHSLGVVDIAGAGGIHLCGGTMGLMATLLLGPRKGRFEEKDAWSMSCPTNVLLGTFILWSATSTILSTIGGGMACMFIGRFRKKTYDIGLLVTGILSALIAITGMCSMALTWHGYLIGACTSAFTTFIPSLLVRLRIDDPINVIPIHFCGGILGLLSSAILLPPHLESTTTRTACHCLGLIYGGGLRLLGVQLVAIISIVAWSAITSLICFIIIDNTVGLRLTKQEEVVGADFVEHGLCSHGTHGRPSELLLGNWKNCHEPKTEDSKERLSENDKENFSTPPDPPDSNRSHNTPVNFGVVTLPAN